MVKSQLREMLRSLRSPRLAVGLVAILATVSLVASRTPEPVRSIVVAVGSGVILTIVNVVAGRRLGQAARTTAAVDGSTDRAAST